jgi:hypothetical protein
MIYHISIGGNPWIIELVDRKSIDRENIDINAHGFCDPDARKIQIAVEGKSEDLINRVILHEITHAMLFVSGLSELVSNELNEGICVMMESICYPIMRFRDGVIVKEKPAKKRRKKK